MPFISINVIVIPLFTTIGSFGVNYFPIAVIFVEVSVNYFECSFHNYNYNDFILFVKRKPSRQSANTLSHLLGRRQLWQTAIFLGCQPAIGRRDSRRPD